jgi:2-polyprenyl-3-methyl-5-hydroxy-6-metoxy-1,4-benzoquinol methylase
MTMWRKSQQRPQLRSGLTKSEIQREVARLAKAAAGDWCPGGGWQFPYDFGDGIIAPTYTPVQAMHSWRRDAMLSAVAQRFPFNREALSVLDLGAGEGAMAIGLWQLGFRKITCVEVRPLNIEKAQFAARVFGADLDFRRETVEEFLGNDGSRYDIVLFMGLLYHLLNPFGIIEQIGRVTRQTVVLETALSLPKLQGFDNQKDYAPGDAAFFLRLDSTKSHTAGVNDFELWPNKAMVGALARHGGFANISWLSGSDPAPPNFANGSRILAMIEK